MESAFARTELLLGPERMQRLKKSHVAVFGVGGVGSFCVEALARSGIGELSFFDHDIISISNINRQLIATHETIGQKKVNVLASRVQSINPEAIAHAQDVFFNASNANAFDMTAYDYVVDAIDTVTSKLLIIEQCENSATEIISSMGTGNKLDPSQFKIADIYETSICPLARVMRHELRKRSIHSLKVLYSTEEPIKLAAEASISTAPGKHQTPGSVSFVPSVAGLMIAGEVIRHIALL